MTERPTGTDHDDEALRNIFDKAAFWEEFARGASTVAPRGLLGIRHLDRPEGFLAFVEATQKECGKLVARTLAAASLQEYKNMAKDMDRLSDLLCRVIDVADFVRVFHQERAMVQAANQAYELMFEYMNVLNTTNDLNEQLKKALATPEVRSSWSEEEIMAAEMLIKDFAHSAVDQPQHKRQAFIDLSNDISQIGTEFRDQVELASDYVGVKPGVLRELGRNPSSTWSRTMIPVHSHEAHLITTRSSDEDARRDIYVAGRKSSRKQIQRLETLLQKRAQLAQLTGFSNYAEMTLSHKSAMAKTPGGVNTFLESLDRSNNSQFQPHSEQLLAEKRRLSGANAQLQPWDIAFLQNTLKQPTSKPTPNLNSFFSLGTVMSGLSRLFQALYGIRLVPRPTSSNEVWSPSVRRLDVISDTEGHIAVIYCDLFARRGKQPNPSHFTLRCSREISAEEIQSEEVVNDGMPTNITTSTISGHATLHQLPVIALVCDFPSPTTSTPTLLSQQNLTTLFHEMGHALHSILGRTSLQTISGTRCATDFAEFPSILMEYFALDPSVLALYARHWETNAPLPAGLLPNTSLPPSATDLVANEQQILMARLDQALHSISPSSSSGSINSTQIFHSLSLSSSTTSPTSSTLPEPPGTSLQGLFSHLYGYGGTYYSYLFDRAIARQVWARVFRGGKDGGGVDRVAGERLRTEVLRWGGGREAWGCLEGLLGDERVDGGGGGGGRGKREGKGVLAEGGEGAMKIVGGWGVGAAREGGL